MKEIEELKWCDISEDGKLDLTEDDGLEYLVKLSEELWPYFDDAEYIHALDVACWNHKEKGFYEEVDKSKFCKEYSLVPYNFYLAYFCNLVDKSYLEKYQKGLLLDALDQWGIDARKFWYLCLGVKWKTEAYQKKGREFETITEQYSSLINLLNKEGAKTLTLEVEGETKGDKHKVEITDRATLSLVREALQDLKNDLKGEFKCWEHIPIRTANKYCKTQTVAYFTAVMDHFLKAYNPKDEQVKIGRTKYKKRDLIAWMVYILEIDLIGEEKTEEVMRDREKFNSEIYDGKKHLKELISSYINKVDPKEFYLGKIHKE